MLFSILAQSGSTPYLGTSSVMGRVAAGCVIAIILVVVFKKLRGKK